MTDIFLSACLVVIIFSIYTAIKVWWWNKTPSNRGRMQATFKEVVTHPVFAVLFCIVFCVMLALFVTFMVDPIKYYNLQWHGYWFPKEVL